MATSSDTGSTSAWVLLLASLILTALLGSADAVESSLQDPHAMMNAMASAALASAAVGAAGTDGDSGSDDLGIAAQLFSALAQAQAGEAAHVFKDSRNKHLLVPPRLGKSVLTARIKQQLLDWHNRMRSGIALGRDDKLPPAANMALLEWDDHLAATASDWAAQCTAGQTDSPANRAVPGLQGHVGQSTAADWLADPQILAAAWWDQRRMFDAATGRCKRAGRHGNSCAGIRYLVSGTARYVGCDLRDCSGGSGGDSRQFAYLLVCNYGELGPGAGSNKSRAYTVGSACSACSAELPHCLRGLCASNEACEALHAAGASRKSKDQCKDAAFSCADESTCAGLSASAKTTCCASSSGRKRCPKLCGICKEGAPNTRKKSTTYQPENKDKIIARVVSNT
ncbi:hypothetical protein BOX15_Mlig003651g1 [Macrostomum lignano]|uniref:SCP domain-containing protein n=2 Tax=Macrostomum lignano TaxID=282301 RepID=A0A1I8HF58_9PLAT|nr:hypothetical protein BOX15_Mlig003651g2 [Macrostomum lignano]PAA63335.1 hypothetical protein BOX15_Mlig003651g1 [Macrostomum lignano]